MKNRVEITGINTSELVALSNEETMDLLEKARKGDTEARDELVYGNLLLVLSVVKRFNHRTDNLDDIFQVGCMGLLKAIDNFDFEHGVRFSTYAVPMIIGEIRRYLRDNNLLRISRSLKDVAYKALRYKEEFQKTFFRDPTLEEMASEIGYDEVDVAIALEAMQEPLSIYTPIYNNGMDEIYLIDQIMDDSESEDKKVLELTIERGLKRLSKREKRIINDRYYEGKTQMEIAEEIGISQAQVSRLEKSAIATIFNKK